MISRGVVFLLACAFAGCLPLFDCGDTLAREAVSPSEKLVAAVFQRTCGATTGYVTHVQVRRKEERFRAKDNASFVSFAGDVPVYLDWRNEGTLVVRADAEPTAPPAGVAGVKIELARIDWKAEAMRIR